MVVAAGGSTELILLGAVRAPSAGGSTELISGHKQEKTRRDSVPAVSARHCAGALRQPVVMETVCCS